MSTHGAFWIEIEIEPSGNELRVVARGSRGERPEPRSLGPEIGRERLDKLTRDVGRAVRAGQALPAPVVAEAQALYEALFAGELRDLLTRLGEAAGDAPLLVRLMIRDRGLQAVPWEALCRPGTSAGFLGGAPKLLLARGVTSSEPWEPREVRGAVRVLLIAPSSDANAAGALRDALAAGVEAGEIAWLDPIVGPAASQRLLFERLRRGPSPHVVHFLGHGGVDVAGDPTLRLADDEDGEEVWIKAEQLAQELAASSGAELRLVVLEACEGAKAGVFGSAAEIFGRAGADAVVAHLWPVKSDVARACSGELYRALTGAGRAAGDVGASLGGARRTLLLQSAEGFSPVLYLRGADTVLFDFEGRSVGRPSARGVAGASALDPALRSVLARPFSLVLGDAGGAAGEIKGREALRRALGRQLAENGDPAAEGLLLPALIERCALRFGEDALSGVFQDVVLDASGVAIHPALEGLARFAGPGVHVALFWVPALERVLAEQHPDRDVYAILPPIFSGAARPLVMKRPRGGEWRRELALPRRFDLATEIVVLRPYGGYTPGRPILTSPMLTDDRHLDAFLEARTPPEWAHDLLISLRGRPALFGGISVERIWHRKLLGWLFDARPAPADSLAFLDPAMADAEQPSWEAGFGLPGGGRIGVLRQDLDELVPQLAALPSV
jgi:hypothetical protein